MHSFDLLILKVVIDEDLTTRTIAHDQLVFRITARIGLGIGDLVVGTDLRLRLGGVEEDVDAIHIVGRLRVEIENGAGAVWRPLAEGATGDGVGDSGAVKRGVVLQQPIGRDPAAVGETRDNIVCSASLVDGAARRGFGHGDGRYGRVGEDAGKVVVRHGGGLAADVRVRSGTVVISRDHNGLVNGGGGIGTLRDGF